MSIKCLRQSNSVAEVTASAMDIPSALRHVLRESLFVDGLSRGIDEAAKALDKKSGKMCVLANDCEEATYKKLVEALCKEHECPLVKVDDKKTLGEMAGLCKIDKDGNARKVVQCSCVVVREFGKDTSAKDYLLTELKKTDNNVLEQKE